MRLMKVRRISGGQFGVPFCHRIDAFLERGNFPLGLLAPLHADVFGEEDFVLTGEVGDATDIIQHDGCEDI